MVQNCTKVKRTSINIAHMYRKMCVWIYQPTENCVFRFRFSLLLLHNFFCALAIQSKEFISYILKESLSVAMPELNPEIGGYSKYSS
jgi:hypothetical protein